MKIDVNQFLKPCSCGRKHEIVVDDIIIDSGAINQLPEILKRPAYADKKSLVMICDENTYEAAGKQVEALVPGLKKIVLNPDNLHANEHGVEAAKKGLDEIGDVDMMIAVGSGTVHDITRFHAYEMKIPFFKKAPLRLTASGVSDLLGKYTALADWKITHLLTGEYICKEICDMEYQALDSLISSLDGLKTGDTKAYEDLMYGLLLSGLAMQMTGNSRPASGAEHHMSHLWEMEVLNDYIDFYHGEKVGVGLVLSSKIYHKAAEKMLAEDFKVKDAMPIEEDLIREKFNKPGMFDIIMEENTPNLLEQVDPKKLIEHKEEIAAIINEIPTSEELIAMINKVEGVKSLEDLGFDESYQAKTAELSPYVRARITFMRLLKFYDFYEEVISC